MENVFAVGKVIRLYVNKENTSIRLDIDSKLAPKDEYFQLRLDHENYNALYSLALAAAVNRLPLRIRTEKNIVAGKPADILYMVVDWESSQS